MQRMNSSEPKSGLDSDPNRGVACKLLPDRDELGAGPSLLRAHAPACRAVVRPKASPPPRAQDSGAVAGRARRGPDGTSGRTSRLTRSTNVSSLRSRCSCACCGFG